MSSTEKNRLEVQICNPYTEEMEAEESVPEVQGHPQLHTEYKDSLFQPTCFKGEKILFYMITKDAIKMEIGTQSRFIIYLVTDSGIHWHPPHCRPRVLFFNGSGF